MTIIVAILEVGINEGVGGAGLMRRPGSRYFFRVQRLLLNCCIYGVEDYRIVREHLTYYSTLSHNILTLLRRSPFERRC